MCSDNWNTDDLLYMREYLAINVESCSTFPQQAAPLHLAACRGHVYAVRCLTDKGADTYTKDARGVNDWEYTADVY